MTKFYLGLHPTWTSGWNWLPDGINVMYSSAPFWFKKKKKWRKLRWPTMVGSRWLDSGGFTMLNKHKEYPFTIAEYMHLVKALKPDYYATMDYPCEPEISRSLGLKTNEERIIATVKNAKKTLELSGLIDGPIPVPVIQGYTIDEYKMCIDMHIDAGTARPYMAVGSMCRRMKDSELEAIILAIQSHTWWRGIEKLHYFGLKFNNALKPLHQFIYSMDSAAALYDYKKTGNIFPKSKEERKDRVLWFLNRAESLGLETTRR